MYPGMYPGTYAGDGSPPRTMKCRDGVYRQAGSGEGGAMRLLVAANDNEHDRQMRADDWYWSADRAALMREAPEMTTGRAA